MNPAVNLNPKLHHRASFIALTNFPQLHPQISVGIELSRELPRVVQDTHEPQEVLRRDRVVNIVVLEQLVRRLDEQELEHAFDDDLLEDPALLSVCERGGKGRGRRGGRKRCWGHKLLEWRCGSANFQRRPAAMWLTLGLVHLAHGLHLGMQDRVEKLPRRRGFEKLHEGAHDQLPLLRAEFADIVFQELLETARAYPRERVVFYRQLTLFLT